MRIQREDLVNDLEMVKAGVSAREFVEQSSCFAFKDGRVMTFNDEVACQKETCLKVTGAVQASSLVSILSKLEDAELDVEESEDGQLVFSGKRKRFGLVKDAEIFLPIDRVEIPDKEKWRPLAPEFTEAIGLVRHCVSTNENNFILTCIHLATDFIESCDNLQAMRVAISTGLKNPVLVRGTSVGHITSLAMEEMALTKSWVHFRNASHLVYSCRRYAEEYPDLSPILKVKGHEIIIPKGLSPACERAEVFASDKAGDALIKVTLSEGKIRLTGEGITGWYKEARKVSYEGPPLEFLVAPELLKHISEKYSDAVISQDKLKVNGGSWKYVTVLGSNTQEAAEDEAPKKAKKKA